MTPQPSSPMPRANSRAALFGAGTILLLAASAQAQTASVKQTAPVHPAPAAMPPQAQPLADEAQPLPDADLKSHKDLVDEIGAEQRANDLRKLKADGLALQVKIATAKRQLAELKAPPPVPAAAPSAAPQSGAPPVTTPGAPIASAQPAPKPAPVLPKVAGIYGAAGHYVADVLVPYRGEQTAQAGGVLSNGMRVLSVTPAGVVVEAHGKRMILAMGLSVPAHPQPAMMPQVQPAGYAMPMPQGPGGVASPFAYPQAPSFQRPNFAPAGFGGPGMSGAPQQSPLQYLPSQYSAPLPDTMTPVQPNNLPSQIQPVPAGMPSLPPMPAGMPRGSQ